jgi:Zn-dependent peptidase ImmA (M78 family)
MRKWQQNIEIKAQNLLLEAGYSGNPLKVDVDNFAKHHGFEIKDYAFQSVEITLDTISGALIVQNGIKTIGVNQFENAVRKRFTIAHELGHFFLNHGMKDGIKLDTYKLYRNDDSSTGNKEEEIQANAFAAALLMPQKHLIDEFLRLTNNINDNLKVIESLASSFDVSQISMSYRLNRLGLMETEKYIF